jgi:hypothetical protein
MMKIVKSVVFHALGAERIENSNDALLAEGLSISDASIYRPTNPPFNRSANKRTRLSATLENKIIMES